MSDREPLTSIVILNYNGGIFIRRCLQSVLSTRYPKYEIILVDNGSTDGSLESIKQVFSSYRQLTLIENGRNLGASSGRNIGASKAQGKYLAFLDSDTEVDPCWLDEGVRLLEDNPRLGAVQCRLMLMSDKTRIDYVGDYLSQFGFLVQRAPLGTLLDNVSNKRTLVFGVKSAGMVVRSDLFRKIGMFDEDFFIYVEETDLCWRIWLSGSQVEYLPSSVVYHAFGMMPKLQAQRTKFLGKYHGTKNYITMVLKNAGSNSLFKMLPVHVFCWFGIMLWHISRKRVNEGTWIGSAVFYNVRNLRVIWNKRLRTQYQVRRVRDESIMPFILRRVPASYLYRKATNPSSGWRI